MDAVSGAPPPQFVPYTNGSPSTSISSRSSLDPADCSSKKVSEELLVSDRMESEMPDAGEDGWRAYYEHPLTAATTAMLNIHGGEEQSSGFGLLYEYCKLPPIDKPDIGLWSAVKAGREVLPPGDVELYLGVKREPEDLTNSRGKPGSSAAAGSPANNTHLQLKEVRKVLQANGDPLDASIQVKREPPEESPPPPPPPPPPSSTTPTPVDNMTSSGTSHGFTFDPVAASQYGVLSQSPPATQQTTQYRPSSAPYSDYYRDYFPSGGGSQQQQAQGGYGDTQDGGAALMERYMRHAAVNGSAGSNNAYKGGLTVDLPSPDSGIGESASTPRDSAGLPQIFDYSELSQSHIISAGDVTRGSTGGQSASRRPWHDFSRSSDSDKIQIPKLYSSVGFRYFLEAPISTSQRREDDRITYINKGQFYGITLEYIPDPDKPLKSPTVKSMIMLVFREEKTPEEEMKAWQFWHGRQHSVKQRILDADTKNSSGLAGCIEEVAHNTIAVYWNPLESPAKVNVAVQCLSTDFSNQKGVKGLPLHLQIDTYDEMRDPGAPPVHRAYNQIKVFCDKGAERKTRDEERRAAKRKLSTPGRKKTDELYHPPSERSEFYSMSDLLKPPMLFTPTGDLDKVRIIPEMITSMELNFYAPEEPTVVGLEKKLETVDPVAVEAVFAPPIKRPKMAAPSSDRGELDERVMLYVRREDEQVYNALHLVPPTLGGLAAAIENKYKIRSTCLRNLYKRSRKGVTVTMDDEMVRHYCNEDTFIIDVTKVDDDDDGYDVTLTEL